MSLKAKIEAVIYASEEPVTLPQLMGLLGQEAQSELDRLEERQGNLALEAGERVEGGAPEGAAAESAGNVEQAVQIPVRSESGEPEESAVAKEQAHEAVAAAEADHQASEKKAARERERRLREFFRSILDELIQEYATSERGLEVREVANGFRMGTKPEYHDAVRGFAKSLKPPLKLSLQALETLAVVAYKQPVTAPEVSEIRGVDSGGVLGSLMARKLVATAGRKQVIGRPILYRTTKDFLLRFGLKDVSELPSIEEFEKMAGELAEQEEFPMPPQGSDTSERVREEDDRITHENLQEEKNATEPQADGNSDSLQPDDSNRPSDELPAVDGRLSGLPPRENVPGDDPSADEAAIQSGEGERS